MNRNSRALRAEIKQHRKTLDAEFIASSSQLIAARFWQSPFVHRSKNLAVYIATGGEVDCWPIVKMAWLRKKRVFAPILTGKQLKFLPLKPDSKLVRNRYNILEPVYAKRDLVTAKELDVVVVPLLAFDSRLNRLGMGAGYYDRSFAFSKQRRRWQHPLLVGAAYSFQQIPDFQPAPWDVPLHVVITEKESVGSH